MTTKRTKKPATAQTADSFQNFALRMGVGTDNKSLSGGTYGFNPLSRNRTLLEWMYRGSWIVRRAIDCPADDMTRAGIEINSEQDPGEIDQMQQRLNDLNIWGVLNETIAWARLYGGAIAVMLIDGQRFDTPLRPETIGKDQFKGLIALDRWMVQADLNNVVTDFGPHYGKPMFYEVVADWGPLKRQKIHYSRVIRIEGDKLPPWQKQTENGWNISVIESLYDRLLAFDSTTTGAAQLVHKAHLRTLKVKDLRNLIAMGGKAYEAMIKNVDLIRSMQTTEGLTLIDAEDDYETYQYTFSGLDNVLLQFGQQLSGALQIPLVRLFGESPAGLNSSGESDIRTYYDGIAQQQKLTLLKPLTVLLDVLHRSEFGKATTEEFGFTFKPLWQLSDQDKASVAKSITDAVMGAEGAGIVSRAIALRELRQQSRITGIWTNIEDADIEEAEQEPSPGELAQAAAMGPPGGQPGEAGDPPPPGKPGEGSPDPDKGGGGPPEPPAKKDDAEGDGKKPDAKDDQEEELPFHRKVKGAKLRSMFGRLTNANRG